MTDTDDALVNVPEKTLPDDFLLFDDQCWAEHDLVIDDECDYDDWNEIHSE